MMGIAATGITSLHYSHTQSASDSVFMSMVRDAIVACALNVYNEATKLGANLKAGTPITTLPVAGQLFTAVPANTTVRVGSELFVSPAGAAVGATSIPVTSQTPAFDHLAGEQISPPTPSNHGPRASYARQVLNAPDSVVPAFAAPLAASGLSSQSPDADIDIAVSADWNALAGA